MKYFAKYLPVEGEIKEGDYHISYLQSLGVNKRGTGTDDKYFADLQRVKLFLCSDDVKIGDLVRAGYESTLGFDIEIISESLGTSVPHWTVKGGYEYAKEAAFKVIGEISPAAGWVKEGDEFDDTMISLPSTTKRLSPIKWYVLIKGPCGHFH